MIVPKELDFLIKQQKDKRLVKRLISVYEALLFKRGRNKTWFDAPSSYLEKINNRYYIAIQEFIKYGIIEYKSVNNEYQFTDVFTSNLHKKKYYFPTQSIKYRFTIDTTEGYEYEVDVKNKLYENEKWYVKTKYSLLQIGFKVEDLLIKRDNFSRRLHTSVTGSIAGSLSYRDILSGGDYYTIDSKTSQPRLLWLTMKEIGFQDPNLNYIFENGIDFYDFIIERIDALRVNPDKDSQRLEAKELFASWINGNGYLDTDKVEIRDIFKVANMFIRNFKTTSYKDICKLLQWKEASIFIDDLLSNVPVDFCLSVHDALIVKKEDTDIVLKYCQESHPELIYKVEEIKKKK